NHANAALYRASTSQDLPRSLQRAESPIHNQPVQRRLHRSRRNPAPGHRLRLPSHRRLPALPPGWTPADLLTVTTGILSCRAARSAAYLHALRVTTGKDSCRHFAALDQGQSSGVRTKPARTGFCSMYSTVSSASVFVRIHRSKDSSRQKGVPVSFRSLLARAAVKRLMLDVISAMGAL